MQIFAKIHTLIAAILFVAALIAGSVAFAGSSAVHADSPKSEAAAPFFVEKDEVVVFDDASPQYGEWLRTGDDGETPVVETRHRIDEHWDRGYGCDIYIARATGVGYPSSGIFDLTIMNEFDGRDRRLYPNLPNPMLVSSGSYDHEIRFRVDNTPEKNHTWVSVLGWWDYAYGRIRSDRDIDEAFSPYGLERVVRDCELRIQGVLLGMSVEPWAGSRAYRPLAAHRDERRVRERVEERWHALQEDKAILAEARARWLATQ